MSFCVINVKNLEADGRGTVRDVLPFYDHFPDGMDAFSLNQDEIHAFRQIPCRQFEGLPSGRQSPFSQIQHAAACIVQHADAEMPCLVQVQFEECRVRFRLYRS